jgi:F-type H+-transporting ATPase subunit b
LAAQQEVKAARDKLQEEVAALSIAAAEEILRKKMRADDQDRLVKDFMTRVVEAK